MSASSSHSPPAMPANEAGDAPPAKRRKISPQEKEAKEREKTEAKARREQDKRAREEEKRSKDEERKRKSEQKAEERRRKEEEKDGKKREKDQEKARKEAEKAKKEQTQPKLSNFFTPKTPVVKTQAASPTNAPGTDDLESTTHNNSTTTSPTKKVATDYERTFLPFEVRSHTVLAPFNFFAGQRDGLGNPTAQVEADVGIKREASDREPRDRTPTPSPFELFKSLDEGIEYRGFQIPSVRDIVAIMQGDSPENPIDLTEDYFDDSISDPVELLKAIPVKYLHYSEDVRPPYCGTSTKPIAKDASRHLMRNPFTRQLSDVDYDYDSEAEWEDPEEGEDLNSDGEEDADSLDGGEDMEGFIDDADDKLRRKLITTDLNVDSSGLCWEDTSGRSRKDDGSDDGTDFKPLKMGMLLVPAPRTIDPYSTAYWSDKGSQPTTMAVRGIESSGMSTAGQMDPPRIPLHARPANVALPPVGAATAPKAVKRQVPPEVLSDFKNAIQGSDLTKLALIEALKKQFPKIPKDAIQNTLSVVAARVGPSTTDKRWTLLQ